jgi:hypothetical protein
VSEKGAGGEQLSYRATHVRAERLGQKTGYRAVFLIEEFLETSTRWTFDPTSPPYETRPEAEARKKCLQREYPWAAFRVVSGDVCHKKPPGNRYGVKRTAPECVACGEPLADHSEEQHAECEPQLYGQVVRRGPACES